MNTVIDATIIKKQSVEFQKITGLSLLFYDEIIKLKQPLLIKNFLINNDLLNTIQQHKAQLKPLYSRGAVPFLYTYFESESIQEAVFSLPMISTLRLNPALKFRQQMRLWQHNAGHVSHLHYDQRSTDLFNLCLRGKKQWRFASPEEAITCWPFFNIATPWQQSKKINWISLEMNAGDLLYIPRNWFHEVNTLENETININLLFNDLSDPIMQQREAELAAIRRSLIPHYIYGDNNPMVNRTIAKITRKQQWLRFIKELTFPAIFSVMLTVLSVLLTR